MDDEFNSNIVMKLTNINRSSFDRLFFNNILKTTSKSPGSGNKRKFTFYDIIICKLITILKSCGLTYSKVLDLMNDDFHKMIQDMIYLIHEPKENINNYRIKLQDEIILELDLYTIIKDLHNQLYKQ